MLKLLNKSLNITYYIHLLCIIKRGCPPLDPRHGGGTPSLGHGPPVAMALATRAVPALETPAY